jgi:hypothetical protein
MRKIVVLFVVVFSSLSSQLSVCLDVELGGILQISKCCVDIVLKTVPQFGCH